MNEENYIYEALKKGLKQITDKKVVHLEYDPIECYHYITLGSDILIVFYEETASIEVINQKTNQIKEVGKFGRQQLTDIALVSLQTYFNINVLSYTEENLQGIYQ